MGDNNNNRCCDGYLYGEQHLDLPRGDNGPAPNHEPKRSSAPWNPPPDRGPLVLHTEGRPKRRGRR